MAPYWRQIVSMARGQRVQSGYMAVSRRILRAVFSNLVGAHAMSRKRAEKVPASEVESNVKRVRLDLSPDDHERLERAAKSKGLNKASFARMAVLAMIKSVEAGD